MAFGTISVDRIVDSEGSVFSPSSVSFRNRIINGDMRIDQRNAGANVTFDGSATKYPIDRFGGFEDTDGEMTGQQDSSAPAGFTSSVKLTTTTADASLSATQRVIFRQLVEGLNVADFAWGSASAKTVTISFWVRSSLTGTHGGAVTNSAQDRSYPFTYSISAADTWEYKTVTVAGDTTGTWLTTNGIGLRLIFGMGVGSTYSGTAGAWAGTRYESATGAVSVIGTLNATWYITGVQLEVGSVATPFERRPYGTELALCQRYYYLHASGSIFNIGPAFYYNSSFVSALISFPVTMRVAPAFVQTTGTNYYGIYANGTLDTFDSFNSGISQPTTQTCPIEVSSGVSGTAGHAGRAVTNNASASIAFNSEL